MSDLNTAAEMLILATSEIERLRKTEARYKLLASKFQRFDLREGITRWLFVNSKWPVLGGRSLEDAIDAAIREIEEDAKP